MSLLLAVFAFVSKRVDVVVAFDHLALPVAVRSRDQTPRCCRRRLLCSLCRCSLCVRLPSSFPSPSSCCLCLSPCSLRVPFPASFPRAATFQIPSVGRIVLFVVEIAGVGRVGSADVVSSGMAETRHLLFAAVRTFKAALSVRGACSDFSFF